MRINRWIKYIMLLWAVNGWMACSEKVNNPLLVDEWPDIYPDYIGVTIPSTIAPMNFDVRNHEACERVDVQVKGINGSIHVNGKKVAFPLGEWQELLNANVGDSLQFMVSVKIQGKWKQYRPFTMYVSKHPIDYGVVYRKIAPGYEVYSGMGIYERNLSNFEERSLLTNTLVPGMCVNCHSFNRTNPSALSLHIRGAHGATLLHHKGKQELLNTKTEQTLSNCVYPYWHPSGDYIAYSTNKTVQSFHTGKNKLIEVFDSASDILVYHPESHELIGTDRLQGDASFETFPAFSSDGTKLYFCTAKAYDMPKDYREVRYHLCSIDFSAGNGSFGERIDTLVNADKEKQSILFPRPSYDGKYLMYTSCDYGTFPIWHKEADLWLMNLESGCSRPIDEVNSNDVESFHNWSSNSHWFLFSSRREDGRYTRIYLASIDEDGKIGKPFLLPQKCPSEYYSKSLYSFNVPDFVSEPIRLNHKDLEKEIVSDKRIPIRYSKSK